MDNEDSELRLSTKPLALCLVLNLGQLFVDVLLQLVDSVHEGGSRVVDLIDDQHAATKQTSMVELVAELQVSVIVDRALTVEKSIH